ncbi:MAG: acetylxylan esterase, partial [Candidatus Hydrogenedentes bacterium]|nr:acetylxylan esterase [Candidatus Hydrogenedentota bacterium]
MFTCALLAIVCAVEEPAVIWTNAYEIEEQGRVLAGRGDYAVWVWAQAGAQPATVTLAGATIEVPASGLPAAGYGWVKAGDVPLEAGETPAALSGPIAALVLSTDPAFDPARALPHLRVFDQPEAVSDARAAIERDTDTLFAMTPFQSLDDWEAYAARLRRRILVSSGLWPLPERTPLNARVFGEITHPDYVVAKAYIEAYPGFYVTGNLYRPPGDGPYPGVACPHGHWKDGRFANEDHGSVAARCITFARMGIVAFSYDMLGYNDSLQFSHQGGQHEGGIPFDEARRLTLWGIHPFALQLWSSMRAVDFLQALPCVDPERIGCTGTSGGGTQTFTLTAVEPRIKVAAPVCMISHSMQGGCVCENAPILRFDASNMEVGALAAPRPLILVSATGDWTAKTPEVEYPAIGSIYALYGAEDRVINRHFDAPHNYNQNSREAVYRFFGEWLLGERERYADFHEPAWEMEPVEALRVFPDGRLPDGAPSRQQIIDELIVSSRAKWAAILPEDGAALDAFRAGYGAALADVLGASVPAVVDATPIGQQAGPGYTLERLVLGRRGVGDQIPALLYTPEQPSSEAPVLIVHGRG